MTDQNLVDLPYLCGCARAMSYDRPTACVCDPRYTESAASVAVEETIRFMDRIHAIEHLDPNILAAAMIECVGVNWPKQWTGDDFARVARQVVGEYRRITGRDR